jgi:hypothetical protein
MIECRICKCSGVDRSALLSWGTLELARTSGKGLVVCCQGHRDLREVSPDEVVEAIAYWEQVPAEHRL